VGQRLNLPQRNRRIELEAAVTHAGPSDDAVRCETFDVEDQVFADGGRFIAAQAGARGGEINQHRVMRAGPAREHYDKRNGLSRRLTPPAALTFPECAHDDLFTAAVRKSRAVTFDQNQRCRGSESIHLCSNLKPLLAPVSEWFSSAHAGLAVSTRHVRKTGDIVGYGYSLKVECTFCGNAKTFVRGRPCWRSATDPWNCLSAAGTSAVAQASGGEGTRSGLMAEG
jgi:hypothetical protein